MRLHQTLIWLILVYTNVDIIKGEADECSFSESNWCNFEPSSNEDLEWQIKAGKDIENAEQNNLPPTSFDGHTENEFLISIAPAKDDAGQVRTSSIKWNESQTFNNKERCLSFFVFLSGPFEVARVLVEKDNASFDLRHEIQ